MVYLGLRVLQVLLEPQELPERMALLALLARQARQERAVVVAQLHSQSTYQLTAQLVMANGFLIAPLPVAAILPPLRQAPLLSAMLARY